MLNLHEHADVQVVVLRGLNLPIEAKLPDFEPLKNNTPLHVMPLYGANIARVLFTWEAFEPERGNYSMQYLDYYMGVVEVCCCFTVTLRGWNATPCATGA